MISVIVPVYNVEAYLPRCIDSILAQSYHDFELLLVNDGSTDDSGKICDKYIQRDRRIRVFHKLNEGVSDARNCGLDQAKGDYICFVDADDYVGVDYLRVLLETLLEFDVDISIISMKEVYNEDIECVESEDKRMLLTGKELFHDILTGEKFPWASWGKLYRREVFSHSRFKKGMIYDDFFTMPYLIENYGCCAFSTSKQYYYYQRENSLTHSISEAQANMWIECMDKLIEFSREKYPEFYEDVQQVLVKSIFWLVIDRSLYSEDYIRLAGMIRIKYKTYFSKAFQLHGLTKKEKIKSFMFVCSIQLYRVIRLAWINMNGKTQRRLILKKA